MKKNKPELEIPLNTIMLAASSALKTAKARLEKNTRAEARHYKETCDHLEKALDQWASAKHKKKP